MVVHIQEKMDFCIICTTFTETGTISVQDDLYKITIKNIFWDLNYKFPLKEHDRICLDCISNLINAYNVRDEAFAQFFSGEPKQNSTTNCILCSKNENNMRTLSYSLPINENNYQLLDIIQELCNYEVEVQEEDKICIECCNCLNNTFKFHLVCVKRLEQFTLELTEPIDKTPINVKLDEPIVNTNSFKIQLRKRITTTKDEKTKIEEKRSNRLKDHTRRHTGERPFRCFECSKSFSNSSNLKSHKKNHTEERPFRCSQCPKSFSRAGNLKVHIRSHTGERPFCCSECPKSFSHSSTLKIHIRLHTGKRPFHCSECSKSYLTSSNLKAHIRTHTNKRERLFHCTVCSKSFSHSSNLRSHIRTHTGERLFHCTVCSKSFSHSSNLKIHVRLHTGERPFHCSECFKSYLTSSNLKAHMRAHTNKLPLKYPMCSKSYSNSNVLKEHMKNHTKKKKLVKYTTNSTPFVSNPRKNHVSMPRKTRLSGKRTIR